MRYTDDKNFTVFLFFKGISCYKVNFRLVIDRENFENNILEF